HQLYAEARVSRYYVLYPYPTLFRSVGDSGAVPAAVPVHREVAPGDAGDAGVDAPGRDLGQLPLHGRDVRRRAVGRAVAAVGHDVHAHARLAEPGGQLQQREQVGEVAVHAAVRDEADQVERAAAPGGVGLAQHRVLVEPAVVDLLLDVREALHHPTAGADVHVADLAVAHLSGGQADGGARSLQGRARPACPDRVEDGRARQVDGVAWPGRRQAEA